MDSFKRTWRKAPQPARRVIIFIIGIACIIAGIAMLVLPGPGWATIFLGLAILATEFEQAERIKSNLKKRFKTIIDKHLNSPKH